jgi:hydroxyacylglutathione hydrolase
MLSVKVFTFSPIQENTYILYNETGQCAIVDPGCYFEEEAAEMSAFITSNKLEPLLLLNTHGHLDHIFGNKYVHETYGIIPHIHEKEKPMLERAPLAGKLYNLPFDPYEGPMVWIEAGISIMLEDEKLEVRFTPGHSPGSLSFYSAAEKFIIGGDVLFRNSIGRTDLPGGDLSTLIKSIKEQFYTLPDETIVYSGHGEATTIGTEKKYNPLVKG